MQRVRVLGMPGAFGGLRLRRRLPPAHEARQECNELEPQRALVGAAAFVQPAHRAQRRAAVGVGHRVGRVALDRLAEAFLGLGVPALLEVRGAQVVVHFGQAVVHAQGAPERADGPVELAFVGERVAFPVPLGRGLRRRARCCCFFSRLRHRSPERKSGTYIL